MHPYISQALAAERVRDLHSQATYAQRRRLVRQAARGQRDRPRHGDGSGPDAAGHRRIPMRTFCSGPAGSCRASRRPRSAPAVRPVH